MSRLSGTVVIILLIGILHNSSGYKWISLKHDNPIPNNAIQLSIRRNTFFGRARHYDELLPAEVFNSSYAIISSCSQEIVKQHLEVLVASEYCELREVTNIKDLPTNIVHAGNKLDGEPIYIGYSINPSQGARIASFLLTSNKIVTLPHADEPPNVLICDDDNNWVDTSAVELPDNAVSGGNIEDDAETFVARLKFDCNVIPGQVLPRLGIATAVYGDITLQSSYCQVLVADKYKYRWVLVKDGIIPDHAVPAGKSKKNELMYVARENTTVGYIVHSAVYTGKVFEVLVKI